MTKKRTTVGSIHASGVEEIHHHHQLLDVGGDGTPFTGALQEWPRTVSALVFLMAFDGEQRVPI